MSIHQAAKDGELELLRKFPKKQFNQADKDGWTPVHWCAWAGNVDPLELALSKGYVNRTRFSIVRLITLPDRSQPMLALKTP